jgi:hypothetical protein
LRKAVLQPSEESTWDVGFQGDAINTHQLIWDFMTVVFFTGFHDIFSTRFNEKNCGYHGILSGYPRNLPMDVAGKNGHLTITMVMGFLMIPDDS